MKTDSNPAYLCRITPDGTPVERWEVSSSPLVVGRGDTVDAFVEDETLSRSHFLLVREADQFILVDLSSSNGTLVDGQPVTARRLKSDDIIQAGESSFRFLTELADLTRHPSLAHESMTWTGSQPES